MVCYIMCLILLHSRTSLIQISRKLIFFNNKGFEVRRFKNTQVEMNRTRSTKIQEYIVSTTKSLAHVAICLAGAHWTITDLLFLESGRKFKNFIDKNFCYQSVGWSLTSITININVICHLQEWGSQFTVVFPCGNAKRNSEN